MKLQLNEQMFNAYINEAIRQELSEGLDEKGGKFWGRIGQSAKNAGKAIAGGTKKATNGVGKYGKALGGNKGVVKTVADEMDTILKNPEYKKLFKEFGVDSIDELPKDVRKNPKKLLQFVKDMQKKNTDVHGAWKTNRNMVFNKDLGTQGDSLVKLERDLTKAINSTKLARTATATAAGGLGAGYLLGRGRNGGNNSGNGGPGRGSDPDAPWNDGFMGGDDDLGYENGGFDGTFPWDNTEPAWTPKPTRPRPAPVPTEPQQETPAQETPAPSRPRMEPLAPISNSINMPTGVTSNLPEPTIQRRYAPGMDPKNVNKWNNTANHRRMTGQLERGVSPDKVGKTLQNRRERQERRYDRISGGNNGQN